jgi:hypothetical protein
VSTPTSPFAIRDYRFYWFARLLSTIAQMAMVIVIGWQVYDIARQTMDIQAAAFQLGLIGLVQFAPLFLLTLVSGWTADRIDRRYIARAVLALEMLCAAILFWATWTGIISLPILFGVAALLGVARAFAGPAFGALAPNLVPREILPKAIAMSSMAWQSGSIAGPGDRRPPLRHHSAPALRRQHRPVRHLAGRRADDPADPGSRSRARRARGGRWSRALAMSATTAGARRDHARPVRGAAGRSDGDAAGLCPRHPDGGPGGAGSAAGRAGGRRDADRPLFLVPADQDERRREDAGGGGGVRRATAVFGLSTWMPLSLAMLALLGAADMFSVYIRQSLIQLHTPDEMRGRVGAASTLAISASNELGEARAGFSASLIGPVHRGGGGRHRRGGGHPAVGTNLPRIAPRAHI